MAQIRVPLLPRSFRWLGVIAMLSVVVYFSLVTVPPEPPSPTSFWDKRLHFAAYAGVALALAYATANRRDLASRRAGFVLGGAVAFGAGIELLQGVSPHRYFAWGDLLANCLGASLVVLWFLCERRVRYVRVKRFVGELTSSANIR